jgi:hypothetical protein
MNRSIQLLEFVQVQTDEYLFVSKEFHIDFEDMNLCGLFD